MITKLSPCYPYTINTLFFGHKETIIVFGSGRHTVPFLDYMAKAKGKTKQNLYFIPTDSRDDKEFNIRLHDVGKQLNIMPHIKQVWINFDNHEKSFEEKIKQMEAIQVGAVIL